MRWPWDLTRDLSAVRFPRFQREHDRNSLDGMRTAFLQDLDEASLPVVLILDTYEQATDDAKQWIEQRLLPHCARHEGLRLVVAGKEVPGLDPARPWSQLTLRNELPPISDPAPWCDYSQRVVGLTQCTQDQITLLVQAASGSPRLVSTLLANLKRVAR